MELSLLVDTKLVRLIPCLFWGPKLFWTVQIILVDYQIFGRSNLFWSGQNNFDQVQIIQVTKFK